MLLRRHCILPAFALAVLAVLNAPIGCDGRAAPLPPPPPPDRSDAPERLASLPRHADRIAVRAVLARS